ncbi:growth arrest-specific protein 1 [Takifugu flavidus]|uniref:growth arrest-specific protein 1 n=1 Tax=Takifugu flavidus TaxID=433684 RepID=UPI00254450F2|nr:growth arrest-specific protein 1 [Takifugu flavidus]
MSRGCRALALLPWVLVPWVLLPGVLVALEAQLLCWQALLRCHQEPECALAYSQYLAACGGTLRGQQQCPSHCINTLIRLNHTRSGPPLEACDCAQDLQCRSAQRAIQPCLPRRLPSHAGGMGCTEARQRCEEDGSCHASLAAYLSYCGQLFNGRRCSSDCKATIQHMLLLPGGVLLDRCVCDGVERPFCEVVKENMRRLCFTGDHMVVSEQPEVDDMYEDEDEDPQRGEGEEVDTRGSPAPHTSSGGLTLLLLPLLWML